MVVIEVMETRASMFMISRPQASRAAAAVVVVNAALVCERRTGRPNYRRKVAFLRQPLAAAAAALFTL